MISNVSSFSFYRNVLSEFELKKSEVKSKRHLCFIKKQNVFTLLLTCIILNRLLITNHSFMIQRPGRVTLSIKKRVPLKTTTQATQLTLAMYNYRREQIINIFYRENLATTYYMAKQLSTKILKKGQNSRTTECNSFKTILNYKILS